MSIEDRDFPHAPVFRQRSHDYRRDEIGEATRRRCAVLANQIEELVRARRLAEHAETKAAVLDPLMAALAQAKAL